MVRSLLLWSVLMGLFLGSAWAQAPTPAPEAEVPAPFAKCLYLQPDLSIDLPDHRIGCVVELSSA
jgi:hypothetical protein